MNKDHHPHQSLKSWSRAPRLTVVSVGAAYITLMLAGTAYADVAAKPWYEPGFGDIVALIGIGVGWLTFRDARWQARGKRKEFVASEMTAFFDDKAVQRCQKILDYTARRMDLSDDKLDKVLQYVRVDHKIAAAALIPHTLGRDKYSRVEVAIRDNFDAFLDRIEKFSILLDAKLLLLEDIKPYLAYWLESIADTEKFLDPKFRRSLWLFIDVYEFTGVQDLCKQMGHPIQPRPDDATTLRAEIQKGEWPPTGGRTGHEAPSPDTERLGG